MNIKIMMIALLLPWTCFANELAIEISSKYLRSKKIWGTYEQTSVVLRADSHKYVQRDNHGTAMIKSGRFYWIFPNEENGNIKFEVDSTKIEKRTKKKGLKYLVLRPQKASLLLKHYGPTIKRVLAHKLKIEEIKIDKLEIKKPNCINKWKTINCKQELIYKNN
jgi:hypothetical protein